MMRWYLAKPNSPMSVKTSHFTCISTVCSAVSSGWHQRKHQSSISLALLTESIGNRWTPLTNSQSCGKRFHIMTFLWEQAEHPRITRFHQWKKKVLWQIDLVHSLRRSTVGELPAVFVITFDRHKRSGKTGSPWIISRNLTSRCGN